MPLNTYVKHRIEPAVCEIDHVGISALIDLLCKPAGIATEVLYLDRSAIHESNEIDTYRWDPIDSRGLPITNSPTFRLLYRPYVAKYNTFKFTS
jgi:ubiquitin thioesterase protein OTUB1